MGIFDFIGKKYNDMKKEMMDAEKRRKNGMREEFVMKWIDVLI